MMAGSLFNEEDLRQITERGLTPEKVIEQIEIFKRGFSYARLKRPCTVGDGIHVLREADLERLSTIHARFAQSGRMMKFVPASGAATRMFKLLLSFNNRYDNIDEKLIAARAEKGDRDHGLFLDFLKGIKKFAFYDDLKAALSNDGLDAEALLSGGEYKVILEYVLTQKGLNLADLPKGLIKFHLYPERARTPFEEHLVEAAAYAKDGNGRVRVHFTVSPEHEAAIRTHIEKVRLAYEVPGVTYDVSFSQQSPSTETIAVDMANKPFRGKDGELLFRPGGHGALLKNIGELGGDIIFIKNIDNVVPDRLKQVTYTYKRALAGCLIELQDAIFLYLKKLAARDVDEPLLREIIEFAGHRLFTVLPEGLENRSRDEKTDFLFQRLNRPLRVCGAVKNVGEPGGGPFWVEHEDKSLSLQIVESSQVDMKSPEQRNIWHSSTYFNPVDLVCGVRDYLGSPFNLADFVDPNTGLISVKSKGGRELKALELPGLWNGSMAGWNTVFVEIPIITFNPVKTVLDLLRKEHQSS